ncbi:MAG: phosphoribosylanthranilate isomerase [Acetobacteraceae bacterium]|nr:phosphoribosylanthranilate isomerase [Acetobacteraceae bacterium]
MPRVKICGINDPAALEASIAGGADWVGFNFFPPSPRYVTPSRARELSAAHQGGPLRVGLFVNPTEAMIAEALAEVHLDILQLYGAPDVVAALRARFGRPVWRAVGVDIAADLPLALDGADALLIEAKPPPDATRPGGNSVSFDWTLTKGWHSPGPWLLAGGLDPGNVVEAVRRSGAEAVDVSSGVERAKGIKDPALIHAFIRNARTA